ncbi:pilus assembly protein [Chloroflexi bacterium CFX2]|nr:pilus assembly protein [Chloroflexi bacterium CFX2]
MARRKEKGQALRRSFRQAQRGGSGQALAEFALVMPILILLLFGMTFAAFYAFRSAATDWGVFITGVASGSYNTPATEHARDNVLWPDLADRIHAGQNGLRQVRSLISVEDSRDWIFGIRLIEAQRAATHFRLWRFYPGPPPAGGIE